MNVTLVIILSFALYNLMYSNYLSIFYFSTLDNTGGMGFSWMDGLFYIVLLLAIGFVIIKEKNDGLKLIEIGIVIFAIIFALSSAVNRVEHFKTHPVRFYQYNER